MCIEVFDGLFVLEGAEIWRRIAKKNIASRSGHAQELLQIQLACPDLEKAGPPKSGLPFCNIQMQSSVPDVRYLAAQRQSP
jgi:hypothetical protein